MLPLLRNINKSRRKKLFALCNKMYESHNYELHFTVCMCLCVNVCVLYNYLPQTAFKLIN